nr:hypothetical protein Iba_chr12fCG8040 [Ipomoea batatas]
MFKLKFSRWGVIFPKFSALSSMFKLKIVYGFLALAVMIGGLGHTFSDIYGPIAVTPQEPAGIFSISDQRDSIFTAPNFLLVNSRLHIYLNRCRPLAARMVFDTVLKFPVRLSPPFVFVAVVLSVLRLEVHAMGNPNKEFIGKHILISPSLPELRLLSDDLAVTVLLAFAMANQKHNWRR